MINEKNEWKTAADRRKHKKLWINSSREAGAQWTESIREIGYAVKTFGV